MKKHNTLLVIDCIVLIVLLLGWLTFAMFTGDTDVNFISPALLGSF